MQAAQPIEAERDIRGNSMEVIKMFEGIGTIGSYAKQWKLTRMAKTKITTGQTVDLNQRQSFSAIITQIGTQEFCGTKKTTRAMADRAKTNSIKHKLKQGRKLSAQELKHLKEKEPALYEKAKVIQSAREELERDLKHCKTKAEVRMALMRASMKVESQAAMADAAAAGATMKGFTPSAGGAVSGTAGAALNTEGAAIMDAENVNAEGQMPQSGNAVDGATQEGMIADDGANGANASQKEQAAEQNLENMLELIFDENKNSAGSAGALIAALEASENSGMDMPPTQVLIIRALQDEYMKFIQSKEYEELPEDIAEAEKEQYKEKPKKAEACKLVAVCDVYLSTAAATDIKAVRH